MSHEEESQVNSPAQQEDISALKAEIERLKANMLKLEETAQSHDLIKQEVEKQSHIVSSIERPTQPISLDEQAKRIYETIVAEDEELYRTTGVRRKYCLRDGGVEMPDHNSSFEYKVLLLHRISEENPSDCSKDDIINMIKRNISD